MFEITYLHTQLKKLRLFDTGLTYCNYQFSFIDGGKECNWQMKEVSRVTTYK